MRISDLLAPRTVSGVRFEVLYPPPGFLDRNVYEKWGQTNNHSLVVKATFKDISFLFPGDIHREAEKELVAMKGKALESDVVLVPHHGSKTSSSEYFVRQVAPRIAVISAGWRNIFRFPHKKVTKRYREQGCDIYRTDECGAIMIVTDGKRLEVQPYIKAEDRVAGMRE